jgi:hypothetical protein
MSVRTILGCFLMGSLLCGAPAFAALKVAHLIKPLAPGDSPEVRIEAPVGSLRAETWDDTSVLVEVELECVGEVEPCRDAASSVALSSEKSAEALSIRVAGPWTVEDKEQPRNKILEDRGWHLTARIQVFYPASRRLWVLLESGAVEVRGLESDGRIRIERGSAAVTMRQRDAGSLRLGTDKGGAVIRRPGEQPLHDKKLLEWRQGDGGCALEVELGEGEIVVDLL